MRLRRSSPDQPGWTRRGAGRGFVYLDEHGARLPSEEVERIRALAIPPAWRDVWICPYPHGHLQAVGTDAAGRRQYLYHPHWRIRRDAAKFDRMLDFGEALGKARVRVLDDLTADGMPLDRACALAVRMLDLGCFRIGNDVYADTHGSFGLTTLRRDHVTRRGETMLFAFTGKSGVEHRIEIDDAQVVSAIETLRRRRDDASGLLAYRGSDGWRTMTPALVNAYVQQITGMEASAKDFRTWHATVLAATEIAAGADELERSGRGGVTRRRRVVTDAMRQVAAFLGNTPTLARTSYVDPRVVGAYAEGRTIIRALRRAPESGPERQLALERATRRLIREDHAS
ncbi:DNA topoisomerase IB [Microbacterium stercoris]|uniref:DNA topoisomerase n=1 Tax=Microbacterium stercoris TaxID=2820289 RepID=A0A939QGF8_9MICO|nr:DNA topoisomerase IB [Microbacterium stercoris]MBO3662467.1 DNA topoisomerase IB [Microbacterium stercoris]MBO3664459.1 DNA topoisomerase IB [Microbacterium stercoris]